MIYLSKVVLKMHLFKLNLFKMFQRAMKKYFLGTSYTSRGMESQWSHKVAVFLLRRIAPPVNNKSAINEIFINF